MKFRTRNETPVRLALLSGHTTWVGPEFKELHPMFHDAAARAGCIASDSAKVEKYEVKAGEGSQTANDHDAAYREAITTMLERDEDGDFTRAGLPNINTVSAVVGFSARKEDVLRVFREMKDEAGVDATEASGEDTDI